MVPSQISPAPGFRGSPPAVTSITSSSSVTFTVTVISSPAFGFFGSSVTELITGADVSEASSVIL